MTSMLDSEPSETTLTFKETQNSSEYRWMTPSQAGHTKMGLQSGLDAIWHQKLDSKDLTDWPQGVKPQSNLEGHWVNCL